jgi:hypothetical protein
MLKLQRMKAVHVRFVLLVRLVKAVVVPVRKCNALQVNMLLKEQLTRLILVSSVKLDILLREKAQSVKSVHVATMLRQVVRNVYLLNVLKVGRLMKLQRMPWIVPHAKLGNFLKVVLTCVYLLLVSLDTMLLKNIIVKMVLILAYHVLLVLTVLVMLYVAQHNAKRVMDPLKLLLMLLLIVPNVLLVNSLQVKIIHAKQQVVLQVHHHLKLVALWEIVLTVLLDGIVKVVVHNVKKLLVNQALLLVKVRTILWPVV